MFIDTTAESAAEGALAEWYHSQRSSWGFLPDYAGCFSTRPDVASAWANLNLTIRGGMDRRRFELVTIAAARARRSTYCTVAHSMFLRDVCGDGDTVDQLGLAPDGQTLSAQDAAVYAFATKIAQDASTVGAADVDALRDAGFTDAEIADVVHAVAARLFFTTVLDGLGARLDPQTAATFDSEALEGMVVGRPIGSA
ncbi:carboxymuconolactone decarboxylase family protein [Occultella aeris]|uniref:Carboxymuconolactone decarboxylase family protein n=1 Tax=Occultella aeris TaxID=2761496 RepID=A0A7M4DMC1_9MICO|nr:carboxymuconolactone decarboxylase family protein [Occultella aeris]VZO38530.1 Carboxymuconolactone decarboxylase family protein [Occultella aeris]